MKLLKLIVRAIYRAKYGVRGGIKPPTCHVDSLAYRWQYRMWKLEASIYCWTGLPEIWWKWLGAPRHLTIYDPLP